MTVVEPTLSTYRASDSRAFYSASVAAFLKADPNAIIGQLSSRQVTFHQSAEAEQIRAWEREIEILQVALIGLADKTAYWRLLIEMPLLRLGKRLDALLVGPGVVAVIEFKIGASNYDSASRVQTELYAQSLRDFHQASQRRLIIPILCAEKAEEKPLRAETFDQVADLILTNAETLGEALSLVTNSASNDEVALELQEFDRSPYTPTPTIVEAAQELYAGHQMRISVEATRPTRNSKPQRRRSSKSLNRQSKTGHGQSALSPARRAQERPCWVRILR